MTQTETEQGVFITHKEIKVGCVIYSPHFSNLIYRDIIDLEPELGFYVNPMCTTRTCFNDEGSLLESPGIVQVKSGPNSKVRKSIKFRLEGEPEFVVVYMYRNTDLIKEYLDPEVECGNYPLEVIAKMLLPDGNYDEFGLEIRFRMDTAIQKHAVNQVYMGGFIIHNWEKLF